METERGRAFLAAGPDAYVFLALQPAGEWNVAWCGVEASTPFKRAVCCWEVPGRWCRCGTHDERSQGVQFHSRSLERARAEAEEIARLMGGAPFDGGEWRDLPPTRLQVSKARRIGISVPAHTPEGASIPIPAVTGAELAEMITRRVASVRIDPLADRLERAA
jgi:hypothetical protein